MEHEDSFDVENFISTPTDEGLPIAPASPQSAAAGESEDWKLPDFSYTPSDRVLLRNHLIAAHHRLKKSKGSSLNAGLIDMNPWELPGMASKKEGRREKYYLTDRDELLFAMFCGSELNVSDGIWSQRSLGQGVLRDLGTTGLFPRFGGLKMTYVFRGDGDPSARNDNKTNWIMNVYFSLDTNLFVNDDLVLCHVFEEDSPEARPKCPAFHQAMCKGNHCVHYPGSTSFNPTPPGSSTMHHGSNSHSDPSLACYIQQLQDILLGDPDPSTDTENCNPGRGLPRTVDHEQSKKRKKSSSDVWDYFTKIFARDPNGRVVKFAVCNHCFNVLTGDSRGGTSHLARHTCPCKLKPVESGRKDGGHANVLSS